MPNSTNAVGFKKRRWQLAPSSSASAENLLISEQLGCTPLMAHLLIMRSITSPEQARDFLNPKLKLLHLPELLSGIEDATKLIAHAISHQHRIVLFGDYDVDGITGTTMLWRLLKMSGAEVRYYIPHRVDEGYGMSIDAVEQIATEGCDLLISIDCGISAIEPVARARGLGIKVIVTDHHEIGTTLPCADAIIHPRLPASSYPNPNLCGAGVAFKLAWATAMRICGSTRLPVNYREMLVEFLALVALATIADVVPLKGENRVLVKHGLEQISRSSFAGIKALIQSAGHKDRKIDGTAVGYFLAPRLNAAGRMDHANLAVELLTTDNLQRATEIAVFLEKQNTQRKITEQNITDDALLEVRKLCALPPALVLCRQGWHAGVVGIVASRIVDTFYRPTFVLATDGRIASGSGRSIPGLDLNLAIEACRDLIISGGGHSAAGGIRLPLANLDLFNKRFCDFVSEQLSDDAFIPSMTLDAILQPRELTSSLIEALDKMAPFGHGNSRPKFVMRGARIHAPPRRVGKDGSHLQLQIDADGILSRAIGFRMGDLSEALFPGLMVDLVFEPKMDEYIGSGHVQMHLVDVARTDGLPFSSRATSSTG